MNKIIFGIDVGGTTVKLGVFSENFELIEKWEIKTRLVDNGVYILDDISLAINSKMEELLIDKKDVIGVGIGIPGPALDDGTVGPCDNLGWGVFNLQDKLSVLLNGIKVKVSNDANIAALGEMWNGGNTYEKNIVLVTLGTGVGGGIIIDGKILNGRTGSAGEIGHIKMSETETRQCTCGKYGCLEQYASATGIVMRCEDVLKSDNRLSLLRNLNKITAKDIFACAKKNDAIAIELVEFLAEMLGKALTYIACTIDPDVFIIGGGVSNTGDMLIELIKKHYVNNTFHDTKNVNFRLAKLGNDAGIFGAIKLFT